MATIVETLGASFGVVPLTLTTLNGTADTFTYRPGQGQFLVLRNTTAGALSPIITGSGSTVSPVDGLGTVTTSTGYPVGSIPATTGSVVIPLDSIALYLKGTITITAGTGLVAALLKSR